LVLVVGQQQVARSSAVRVVATVSTSVKPIIYPKVYLLNKIAGL